MQKKVKASVFAKENEKFQEIQNQKKTLEKNIRGKQELHIKSVMFERDNLQMELEDALGQIEKLENEVDQVRNTSFMNTVPDFVDEDLDQT